MVSHHWSAGSLHRKESSYCGDVEQNWEGLDIRETDTLTSKCRISDVICFSLLECRVSVRDRVVLWRLYTIHCSVESVHVSLFFGVCSQFTVLWSLHTVHCLWSLHTVYRLWSLHAVHLEVVFGSGRYTRVGLRRKDHQDDFQRERERTRKGKREASW